jgi:hypothetical protein
MPAKPDTRAEVQHRVLKAQVVILNQAVFALISGWYLSSDGLGIQPFLPFLIAAAIAVLCVYRAATARHWSDHPQKRALLPVVVALGLAVLACVIGWLNDRIDAPSKITGSVGFTAAVLFLWRGTVFVLRQRKKLDTLSDSPAAAASSTHASASP